MQNLYWIKMTCSRTLGICKPKKPSGLGFGCFLIPGNGEFFLSKIRLVFWSTVVTVFSSDLPMGKFFQLQLFSFTDESIFCYLEIVIFYDRVAEVI